jgi:hypothetical protein
VEDPDARGASLSARLAPHRFAGGHCLFNGLRRDVADLLRAHDADRLIDDAVVIVTELANNAAVHSGGAFAVDAVLTEHVLRLEVHDASHRPPPVDGAGLGLHLGAQLASRWGVEDEGTGKVVWAELNRTDRRGF